MDKSITTDALVLVTLRESNNPHECTRTGGLLTVPLLLAGVFSLLATPVAAATTLATVNLTSGKATFGLPLPQGAATTGVQVTGLATQTDVKTRWPDGSIRFAVVSATVPSAGTYPIAQGPASTGSFVPTVPTASVQLTIGTTVYTATLPQTVGSDVWLNGPIVQEWRSIVVPKDPANTLHPFLHVLFDTRVYADGQARIDVTVENVFDLAGATKVSYVVDVLVNNQPVYHHDLITHYYLTRWHKVFGVNLTASTVTPDFTPFIAAGALPPYLSIVPNTIYTLPMPDYDILHWGGNVYQGSMEAPGGRPELAPYPSWVAEYMIHKDPSQLAVILANGDLAGSFSVHVVEPANGKTGGYVGVGSRRYISIDERPNFWLDRRADAKDAPAGDLYATAERGSNGILTPENGHVPSLAYVPYLITGDRYYVDEMTFWANWALLGWPVPRGGGGSVADPYTPYYSPSYGLIRNAVRALAWGLRNLVDAAAYTPNVDSALRSYLTEKAQNNLKWGDDYINQTIPWGDFVNYGLPILGPVLLLTPDPWSNPGAHFAQWQNDFLAWSIAHAQDQGFSGGLLLRNRIVSFANKLFNSAPDYPKAYAAPYWQKVASTKNADGSWQYVTTMLDFFNLNYVNPTTGVVSDPVAFAGNYGANARLSLMAAIQLGLPGAQSAYDYLYPQISSSFTGDMWAGWAIASLDGKTLPSPSPPPVSSPSPSPADTTPPTLSFSPALDPSATYTLPLGSSFSFTVTAADSGSGIQSLTATGLPSGATFQ